MNQTILEYFPRFRGTRFIPPSGTGTEMTIIFDKNGFVAGVQSLMPLSVATDEHFHYSTSPYYQRTVIEGVDVSIFNPNRQKKIFFKL